MAKNEQLILGIVLIIISIITYFFVREFWFSITPLIIGLALIIFRNSENEIEKRRDKND